jgi:hypothetical protein
MGFPCKPFKPRRSRSLDLLRWRWSLSERRDDLVIALVFNPMPLAGIAIAVFEGKIPIGGVHLGCVKSLGGTGPWPTRKPE